jgi:cytochrome oxidase Cu insertion factor (SCO1/SenC/PrrC family)
MRRIWLAVAFISICTQMGCSALSEHEFVSQVKNKPARDFTLTALDGAEVRLRDYRGRPVLLSFWAVG